MSTMHVIATSHLASGDRFAMDIYCYYQPLCGDNFSAPKGPLLSPVLLQTITEANKQVQAVETTKALKKMGKSLWCKREYRNVETSTVDTTCSSRCLVWLESNQVSSKSFQLCFMHCRQYINNTTYTPSPPKPTCKFRVRHTMQKFVNASISAVLVCAYPVKFSTREIFYITILYNHLHQ